MIRKKGSICISRVESQATAEAAQECSCAWRIEEYCVGMTTVSDLRKQEEELFIFTVMNGS